MSADAGSRFSAEAIVTRADADAEALCRSLETAGFRAIRSACLRIAARNASRAERTALGAAATLAFTSANGVRAYAAQTHKRSATVFAVGPATAAAARIAGFATVLSADGDVESLAHAILAGLPSPARHAPLVHVSGADAAGDLIGALAARGVAGSRIVLYEAQKNSRLSESAARAIVMADANGGRRLWATLFSPRTADAFVDQLENGFGAPEGLRLAGTLSFACLSDAVAARLTARLPGLASSAVCVAKARHEAALIAAMKTHSSA